MNIIENTIYQVLVDYAQRNSWLTFDGTNFYIHSDKLDGINLNKDGKISFEEAWMCLKEYLKITNKPSKE